VLKIYNNSLKYNLLLINNVIENSVCKKTNFNTFNKYMVKYICQCGCEVVVEVEDGKKIPQCCGKPMKKVADDAKVSGKGCCCCS